MKSGGDSYAPPAGQRGLTGAGGGTAGTGGEVNRRSDLSRLLISEKTEYESRAIVYYRGRNGWDYSCCVKLNRPAAAATLQYVM